MKVEDTDLVSANEDVDDIFVEMILPPSTSFTDQDFFTGESGIGRIELSFRVLCSPGFTGDDCSGIILQRIMLVCMCAKLNCYHYKRVRKLLY